MDNQKTLGVDWDQFTKRNQVIKTMRWELVPTGNTLATIQKQQLIEQDAEIAAKRDALKPVIDAWIRELISKALGSLSFDFGMFEIDPSSDKEDEHAVSAEESLKSKVEDAVHDAMPKELSSVANIFSSAFVHQVLYNWVKDGHYGLSDEEVRKTLDDIKSTEGYMPIFKTFLTSRITALSTWMPDRVLENLDIYQENANFLRVFAQDHLDVLRSEFPEMEQFLQIDGYKGVLTPEQIDAYNLILSGIVTEKGTEKKGLIQTINEINQKNRADKNYQGRFYRRPKQLYKQILMPQAKAFEIQRIETDDAAREVLKKAKAEATVAFNAMNSLLEKGTSSNVVVSGKNLHQLSYLLTEDHGTFPDAAADYLRAKVKAEFEAIEKPTRKQKTEYKKLMENTSEKVRDQVFTFSEIDQMTDQKTGSVYAKYCFAYKNAVDDAWKKSKFLDQGSFKDKNVKGNKYAVDRIREITESWTNLRSIVRLISDKGSDQADAVFYNEYADLYSTMRVTDKAERLVRAYITRKAADDTEKSLTFLGVPTRLDKWWMGDKTFSKADNGLISMDGKYYYFVLTKDTKPVSFKDEADAKILTIRKLASLFRTLPRLVFSCRANKVFDADPTAQAMVIEDGLFPVEVTRRLYEINRDKLATKGAVKAGKISEEEMKENAYALMDLYKEFLRSAYPQFNISSVKDNEAYADMGEFFADLDTCAYQMTWQNISKEQIEQLVAEGKALMFEIRNRYLYSSNPLRDPNCRMLLAMLDDNNVKNTTVRLNAAPEVYFRPALTGSHTTHAKNSILVNKRDKEGKKIPEDVYSAVYRYLNNKSVDDDEKEIAVKWINSGLIVSKKATHDIVKDARYYRDMFFIHFSVTVNSEVSARNQDRVNDRVNEMMSGGCNVVAISRSAKDLLHMTVLDPSGKVLDNKSLNVLDGVDYADTLRTISKGKKAAQQAWSLGQSAEDIKHAYLDRAITEIAKCAYKHHAVIVVEFLSDRIKDKYSAIDNQAFETFETKLRERLSHLSFSGIEAGMPGSASNPLQMTNNNTDAKFQDGILFFIGTGYTRGVDPETGFFNLFQTKDIHSIQAKREFLALFKEIRFDGGDLVCSFDYDAFATKTTAPRAQWELHIGGEYAKWEKETGRLVHSDDMVGDFILPVFEKNAVSTDGNLAEKALDKQFKGVCVETLYKFILEGIRGRVVQENGFPNLYKSPVTGKEYDEGALQAELIGKKFQYRCTYDGDLKVFNDEWLAYLTLDVE